MDKKPKLTLAELNEIFNSEEVDNNQKLLSTMVMLLSEIKKQNDKIIRGMANLIESNNRINENLMPFKRALIGSTILTFPDDELEILFTPEDENDPIEEVEEDEND